MVYNRTCLMGTFVSIPTDAQIRLQYSRIHRSGREGILRDNVLPDRFSGKSVNSVNLLMALESQLPLQVRMEIARVQQALYAVEPSLILTRPGESHITVFSISPAFNKQLVNPATGKLYSDGIYDGENFYDKDAGAYMEAIRTTLRRLPPFELRFSGIFISRQAICVQGFDGGAVNSLRASLLAGFEGAGLKTSDWQPNITHMTIARFRDKLRDPSALFAAVEGFREHNFGGYIVAGLPLVRVTREYLSEKEVLGELPFGSSFNSSINALINDPELSLLLVREFFKSSIGDENFIALIRSTLSAALAKGPALAKLYEKFSTMEMPDLPKLSDLIKKRGLIRSLEYQEIKELFMSCAPEELLNDPRMQLLLDDRSLPSIFEDPLMRASFDAFKHFIYTAFNLESFLEEHGDKTTKPISVRSLLNKQEQVLAPMKAGRLK